MIYALFDVKKRILTFCRAGHTPLLLQKSDGSLVIHSEGNFPVGLSEQFNYEQFSLHLQPGDRLIFYSDGITEARRNGSKEFFGEGRLYELLRQTREKPVEQAVHDVVEGFRQWLGDTRPPDDITLMIVESQ